MIAAEAWLITGNPETGSEPCPGCGLTVPDRTPVTALTTEGATILRPMVPCPACGGC